MLALGGRLTTGPEVAWDAVREPSADLVVTGCAVFDFGTRGGGVVAAAAAHAERLLAPCIVVAGEVLIGGPGDADHGDRGRLSGGRVEPGPAGRTGHRRRARQHLTTGGQVLELVIRPGSADAQSWRSRSAVLDLGKE